MAQSCYILYVAMMVVPIINCANHGPGVKFSHATGVDSLHRLTMGKHQYLQKASWRFLIKLHTQHHWAVEKVAYCFWTDRTGTLVAMATYSFKWKTQGPWLTMANGPLHKLPIPVVKFGRQLADLDQII